MNDSAPYAVDGIHPARVERPTSVGQVREVLASADTEGLAVAPVGGGGALGLGNPIERYDVALDLTGLDRILDHQATDLVLSVEAGARFADVAGVLSAHGQWLPVDVPRPERATIGGLVATALSGPSRAAHGSLRDYLIGITVATPGGDIAKAGGMVVKNVSGFDLMRLHHGALGTLGVIVSANFKVLPRPRSQATLLASFQDLASALANAASLDRAASRPSALVVTWAGEGTAELAARWDGAPGQVSNAASAAAAGVAAHTDVLDQQGSAAWWAAAVDHLADGGPVEMRLGTTPGRVPDLVEHLLSTEERDISLSSIQVWPALGVVIVEPGPETEGASIAVMATEAERLGATWRLTAAPAHVKRGRDVWGQMPASIDTMRRLKHEFDPNRTLNPGRFCGYL